MKLQIKTEIVIHAPRKRVWDILVNLEEYREWNPFIVKSQGTFEKGSQITNTMLNGDKQMTFKPVVLAAEPYEKLEWLGSLWFKGLFDGHHYFHLQELPDSKTKLVHGEYFSGLLSKMVYKKISDETKANFVKMNRALKEKAEQGA